jgi:hypothetical protein
MLDDPHRRLAAVPHQRVERRDMNQEHTCVIDTMPSVRWVLLRRIMFQINARQPTLNRRQHFELVDFEVAPSLKEDAVKLAISHLTNGQLEHVLAERKACAAAAITAFALGTHRQVKIVLCLGQVPKVIAVDVPGEYSKTTYRTSMRFGDSTRLENC